MKHEQLIINGVTYVPKEDLSIDQGIDLAIESARQSKAINDLNAQLTVAIRALHKLETYIPINGDTWVFNRASEALTKIYKMRGEK